MNSSLSRGLRLALGAAVITSGLSLGAVFADAKGSRSVVLQRPSIMADQITSFFIRGGEQNRIMLSMRMGHNFELTTMVRQLTGDQVTPVFVAVSTLPDRQGFFDPMLVSFEQNGKIWKPNPTAVEDLLPLTAETAFGGDVSKGQVHQGVFFAPAWLNPSEPVIVHYGDFRYQARFIDKR